MSSIAEGVGDVATGALLAHEVERAQAPGHDHSTACANCGAGLRGPYCHACGQQGHVHRTASAFFHDVLHGVFHFEGKIWKTLPMLAWRPGELTRRYVHGERASFVSPMALFLFSVFLMFAVLSNLTGFGPDTNDINLGAQGGMTRARDNLGDALKGIDERIDESRGRLARLQADPARAADVAEEREDLRKLLNERRTIGALIARFPARGEGSAVVTSGPAGDWLVEKYRHAMANPQLLFYKIKNSAYKFSWALIPISLPFIWLLFPLRRGVGMYDHAVFATYSLAFMSLLVIALALLSSAGMPGGVLGPAFLLLVPWHMYRQLKGAYQLGRAGAVWRTFLLVIFTTITSVLFALLLLYLGVAD